MTTAPPAPELRDAVVPESTQPGGGFCAGLEQVWARCRRAWLRRFRPGYVRRMAAIRRGECVGCRHDVIDPRDLKYCRPACGYSWDAADDLYAWRGRVRLARAGLAEVILFSVFFAALVGAAAVAALLWHPAFWSLAGALAVLWFELIFFFRDPERVIPTDAAALVSPADGTVTFVGEVEDADFPNGRAFRVSIFLSVFNVHVNRAPRAGCVDVVRYFRGCFLDARHADCAVRNEQLWLDLREDSGRLVRVKQISGAIARRIVCWAKAGDRLEAGERFGMIKFGSRTDVLVPAGDARDVLVKPGDTVKGGSTVLFRFVD